MPITRSPKSTVCGRRNHATAARTWASSARRISLDLMEESSSGGTTSKWTDTPKQSPRRSTRHAAASRREPLSRLLHVAVKDKEPIGVAIGIGEVELLALAKLDAKVLVLVVHLEGFQIVQRRGERIVLVSSLVSDAVRGSHQSPLTRAYSMFMDDSERCVESHLAKSKREIARAWLNVDALRDSVEPFGGHIHLVG